MEKSLKVKLRIKGIILCWSNYAAIDLAGAALLRLINSRLPALLFIIGWGAEEDGCACTFIMPIIANGIIWQQTEKSKRDAAETFPCTFVSVCISKLFPKESSERIKIWPNNTRRRVHNVTKPLESSLNKIL